MKVLVIITRTLLGLVYFGFGLAFFFHLLPNKIPPGAAGEFDKGLFASGYFFYFLKIVETVCGFFLLINKYTVLFLVLIFPVTLNIFLFHAFLEPQGLAIAVPILLINLFLFYAYRAYYKSLLTASATIL
jgi:putative oxidoreductase